MLYPMPYLDDIENQEVNMLINGMLNASNFRQVRDTGSEVLLRASLPGVKKENLKITYSDGWITIKGNGLEGIGEFNHSITIGYNVNLSTAKASLEDGILQIRIQKNIPNETEIRL